MARLVSGVVLALVAAVACRRMPPGARVSGLELSWNAETCGSAVRDRDADGIDDDCELALAQAFAPELVVDVRDCLWDGEARPGRLAGGYFFAVGPVADDLRVLRIAYLPAYYRDCGWSGLVCVTRAPGCSAHDGDSELLVVEARFDPTTRRWATDGVFLSAHCLGRSDGRCRWYRTHDLERFAWTANQPRGAPRVWVAKGKHGNYPSAAECDAGHWSYDSCDDNATSYRFPVVSDAQNIGSRRRPRPESGGGRRAGCVSGSAIPQGTSRIDRGAVECFWNATAPFRGWQRTRGGTAPTPYARLLEYAAGF